ncbi:hypothetical protein AVEN_241514-1 [Araneus ventricosus]|uniref:Uncharacterized protein n=1 Tax=Araneus ventricosus TaxID=182803 RepID=A0A4Y2AD55_ARAVE|nr:hypothetical protein AVEN_241514-1 [Araneus ventricosus]
MSTSKSSIVTNPENSAAKNLIARQDISKVMDYLVKNKALSLKSAESLLTESFGSKAVTISKGLISESVKANIHLVYPAKYHPKIKEVTGQRKKKVLSTNKKSTKVFSANSQDADSQDVNHQRKCSTRRLVIYRKNKKLKGDSFEFKRRVLDIVDKGRLRLELQEILFVRN